MSKHFFQTPLRLQKEATFVLAMERGKAVRLGLLDRPNLVDSACINATGSLVASSDCPFPGLDAEIAGTHPNLASGYIRVMLTGQASRCGG